MSTFKRWISALLVLCLCLSLLPTAALAAEADRAMGSAGVIESVPGHESVMPMDRTDPPSAFGIDVSHHQGTIDWDTVASQIDFAIIRCGYGDDVTSQDDRQWVRNVEACTRLGIPFGVYIYSYALSEAEAISEANHVLRLIAGYNPTLPIYFDLEDSSILNACSTTQILNITRAFCNKIEAAGYRAGVYANHNWWTNYLTSSEYDQWDRWIARYSSAPGYSKDYTIWQYSSTGSISGISGNVDMNYWYGPFPPQSDECTCSTAYAGYYTCTTASANLLIRSGHGTGFGIVGRIPSGATVYVSKASGTGAGHWAHVEYNGIIGFASMEYLEPQTSSDEVDAKISKWISYEAMGDSISSAKVGDRVYLCYRMYDANSGDALNVAVPNKTYTATETIYNPDGSVCYTYTYDNADSNWISVVCLNAGTYTYEVVLEGDWIGTFSGSFVVEPNPMKIHAAVSDIGLTLGGTESQVVYVWATGYHTNSYIFSWGKSNDNVSCSWGDWEDARIPLTISANSPGTTTITLSVKDAETKEVLDTCTINATVSSKSYTVSYNANGGSGAPGNQTKTHGTALTLSSTVPTRFGYTFLGWSTSSSATSATYLPGGSFSTNANTTLYAVWQSAATISSGVTSSSYSATISFANGYKYYSFTPSFTGKIQLESSGSSDTKVYIYDASGNQLSYNDDGGDNTNFLLTQSVTSGTKYYVKVQYYGSTTGTINFTAKRAYDITYNANGGSGAPSAQVKVYGTTLTLSTTAPSRPGYTFQGWATSSSATSASYQPGGSFTTNADTTLYAVWRPITYTISYNANGGSGAPSSQIKTHGVALTLSTAKPTRSGYTFQGWATSSSATTAAYQPGDSFTTDANTTLYAVWNTGTYTISYNANGGSGAPGSQTKTHGVPLTLSTTEPTRSGYTFQGWAISSTAATAAYQPGDSFTTNANTTLYAVWEPITYTISYNANGGSGAPSSQIKTHGVTLTLSTTKPTRSGYTFQGWATSSTAATTSYQPGGSFTTNADTTLYAVWASSDLASGSCGTNLTWTLGSSGTLFISGTGTMRNYEYKSEMPWYSYRDQIKTVVLESGVTSIGDYAFYGMPALESIEIPATVTSIGTYAFKNATALDDVVLPAKLSKLGESAFYACTSLTSIDIPASLYTIQPYTFKNCTALAEVTFHEGNLQKISDGAFYNTALTELILPDCLTILDVYSFKNCAKLRSIELGSGLTQIREAVFYGTAIPAIEIPEGVTSIGPYAFKNCTRLVSIDLPSTLTSIGEASFYACTALESLDLPDAVTKIGNYAFRKCTSLLDVSFGSGLQTIGESSFYGCESIVYLTIPAKVTTIQAYAFKGCTDLEIVNFSGSLTTLGDSAFHTCTSLSEITIPAKVTKIGDYCFSGSAGIDRFYFLGNAPTIGSGAFNKITATAYYPEDNSTWTASVRQNYGGSINWVAQ